MVEAWSEKSHLAVLRPTRGPVAGLAGPAAEVSSGSLSLGQQRSLAPRLAAQ